MKKLLFFTCYFCFITTSFAQAVAINTTTPSEASVLHLEAQQSNGVSYGGFLMPVVTEDQQAAIPVSVSDNRDDGLMVFVSDPVTGKQCWEIYDSFQDVWRSISCSNTCDTVLYNEDFNSYAEQTGISGANNSNGDYPSGVTKWTLSSYSTALDGSAAYPGSLGNAADFGWVAANMLEMQDVNGPFSFQTQAIDISNANSVGISFDVTGAGGMEYAYTHTDDFNCGNSSQGNDYLDIEISTDGGSIFTEVPNYNGEGNSNHTIIFESDKSVSVNINGYSGTSMIIRIRMQNWSADESFKLDNIKVFCE